MRGRGTAQASPSLPARETRVRLLGHGLVFCCGRTVVTMYARRV